MILDLCRDFDDLTYVNSASDMLMLSICNGRERDREDWEQVFKAADTRFKILDVYTPKPSALGIIDVLWK